jgi:hypothetical protein
LFLSPENAIIHHNLGVALQEDLQLAEAKGHFQRAIELQPDYADAISSLASIFHEQGRSQEVIQLCRKAITLEPAHVNAHFHMALAQLRCGDFENGWSEYEWRWHTGVIPDRKFHQPRWNGEPLAGKTILLHAEQGYGDTLQFIRYASFVKQWAQTVILECPARLLNLLNRSPNIDRLVAHGDPLPAFDVHAPLLSLPRILKTSLQSIPQNVPYLFADPALIEYWRERLQAISGFRIGINWHGRVGHGSFLSRDIPLASFVPLAQLPAVRLISLQRGPDLNENAAAQETCPLIDLGSDLDVFHGPFMDSAAIMMNLDLVITSDTSIPHLAGGLGVPVWLALSAVSDWRWLQDRSDSPWYPTMRLFRQKQAGDWASVFAEMRKCLTEKLD